jgi:hypothetical protein
MNNVTYDCHVALTGLFLNFWRGVDIGILVFFPWNHDHLLS